MFGVTGSLMSRMLQHKSGECEAFTQKYKAESPGLLTSFPVRAQRYRARDRD